MFKWLITRSAYLAIVSILVTASIASYWLPPDHRIRAGTVLLGLVITRFVARWLSKYAELFVAASTNASMSEALERRLRFLLECQLEKQPRGSHGSPIYIKTK
ncbi:MAG: hypothetical protein OXH54_13835 [Acidimicrobiaceae bacterium]|nr:hypothetical protein [Acidimicrobiaceae bacterium]